MREKSDIYKSGSTHIPYSGDYADPIWTKDRDFSNLKLGKKNRPGTTQASSQRKGLSF